MLKQNVELYAQLEDQRRKIEAQQEEIKKTILESMLAQKANNINCSQGSFRLTERKSWKYTEAVDNLTKQLKDKKKEEEAMGTATFTSSPSVSFYPNKPGGEVQS